MQQFLFLDSLKGDFYNSLGTFYLRLQIYEKALESFEHAFILKEKYSESEEQKVHLGIVANNLGILLIKFKNYERAEKVLLVGVQKVEIVIFTKVQKQQIKILKQDVKFIQQV